MIQIATVRNVEDNGMAKVQIRRKTACGHDCADCAGCTQVITEDTVVSARNGMEAKVGDVVVVQSQTFKVLKVAAIVYLLPFLLFFIGYFLLSYLSGGAEGALPALGGVIGFLLGILVAWLTNHREKRMRSLQYNIVEIKRRCSDM